MMRRTTILLLQFLLLAPAAPGLAQECPGGALSCLNDDLPSSAPVAERDCSDPLGLHSLLGFDAPHGLAYAESWGPGFHYNLSRLVDEFTVSGAPPGTPLLIMAVCDVRMDTYMPTGGGSDSSDASSSVGAVLIDPADGRSEEAGVAGASLSGWVAWTRQVRMEFTIAPGTPFLVEYKVGATTTWFARALVRSTLRFEGLPPGARIASCKGFLQDAPVPALARSWGQVKAAYR